MGSTKGVVIIGHGFVSEPKDDCDTSTISTADRDRVVEAVRIAEHEGAGTFFFTEDVPCSKKFPHVSVAWCNQLVLRNVTSPFVRYKIIPGKNPYEQSWNTCNIARSWGITRLTVIASHGYFETFGRMWERVGDRHNLHMVLVSAKHPKGHLKEPVADTHDSNKWDLALADMATAGGKFGHQLASLLANLVIRNNVRV